MAAAQLPAGLMQMLMSGMQQRQMQNQQSAGMNFISQNGYRPSQAPVAPTVQMPAQTDYGKLAYQEGQARRKAERTAATEAAKLAEFEAGMVGLEGEELRRYLLTHGQSAQARSTGGSMMEEAMYPTQKRAQSDFEVYQNDPAQHAAWSKSKKTGSKPLVQFMGGTELTPGFMTEEQKIAQGIPTDKVIHTDSKGKMSIIHTPSEGDKKAQSFYGTMEGAESRFDSFAEIWPDFDPASYSSTILSSVMAGDDKVLAYVANAFGSDAEKAYANNAMDWISANRAYISGAAVPELEFKRDMVTYFPQPNDSEGILEMKRNMRLTRQQSIGQTLGLSQEKRQASAKRQATSDWVKVMKRQAEEKRAKRRSSVPEVPVQAGNMNDGSDRRRVAPPPDGTYEYRIGPNGEMQRQRL